MNIEQFYKLIYFSPTQDVIFDGCDIQLLGKGTILINKSENEGISTSFKKFLKSLKERNINIYDVKRVVITASIDKDAVRSISKNDIKVSFNKSDKIHISLRNRE